MGETTEFSVLLDRLGDPVDLGVPPDGFVDNRVIFSVEIIWFKLITLNLSFTNEGTQCSERYKFPYIKISPVH